jgi:hypothetical protein
MSELYDLMEGLWSLLWEFPIIWVILLIFYILKRYEDSINCEYAYKQNYLFIGLLLLIIIGFIISREKIISFSCLPPMPEPIIYFTPESILYSATSILFVVSAWLFKDKNLRLLFVCVELLFWMYKLFVISKPYFMGFGGSVPNVSVYDFFALGIRLQLINSVIGRKTKLTKVVKLATVVIVLKVVVDMFSVPLPS